MIEIRDILSNFPLMMGLCGWFVAQVLKFLLNLAVNRELNFGLLASSGGMPSSHSATVCAMTVAVGIIHGFGSTFFAVCFIFSFIVMYDAMNVRRSAGEQAQILNKLILDLLDQSKISVEPTLREILGHTPLQVVVGAIIGIAIPVAVYEFGIMG